MFYFGFDFVYQEDFLNLGEDYKRNVQKSIEKMLEKTGIRCN